jgi:hypothetical protein
LALGASRQGVSPAAASWGTVERLGEGGTAGRASLSVASYKWAPACFEIKESRKSRRGTAVSLGPRAQGTTQRSQRCSRVKELHMAGGNFKAPRNDPGLGEARPREGAGGPGRRGGGARARRAGMRDVALRCRSTRFTPI